MTFATISGMRGFRVGLLWLRVPFLLALSAGVFLGGGCSRAKDPARNNPTVAYIPQVPISSGPIQVPPGESKNITLPNGGDIIVYSRGGTLYFEAEGTLAETSFTQLMKDTSQNSTDEKAAILGNEIKKILDEIRKVGGVPLKQVSEIGYFTFMLPLRPELPLQQGNLMAALKPARFRQSVIINPVIYDMNAIRNIRALSPSSEGMAPQVRGDTRRFSGLERIGAVAFAKQAEADIGVGVKVNGSSVNIGITDTGITYNHPTFLSANGNGLNRIKYLRDFTKEGRVYFNPTAKFEVTVPQGSSEADLTLNAQIIATPRLPNVPAGDTWVEVKDLKVKVSPELRKILTAAGSGAKLGVLLEDSLQGDPSQPNAEAVDINGNGKLNDQFWMILIPGQTPDQDVVYVDMTGTGDFRNSKPLGDWNKTKATLDSFAERFGFELKADKLPKADGSGTVEVRSASIVGFDPGNHGTHVSGIAAGSKTILNDSADTLARGVAPEASIFMNRVCANNGGCNATEAFVDLAVNGGVDVINMSLGGLSPFNDGYGVQETLINRLTAVKNVLFVISAGNSGPGRQTVGSPSVARLSLSVGASASKGLIQRQYEWPGGGPLVDEDSDSDFMLFFSSRGPTANGGFKPNVAAPGTELSSIQLNSPPGARGGLDVYWGTSMAAPTATGAYALFLDAIRKYNDSHRGPGQALSTNATLLREILIQSAKPFDVNRFDAETNASTSGRYTWVDQGNGIIDLVSAWKKIQEVRDNSVPSAVKQGNGVPLDLDYQVIVPFKAPNGIAYDGSRAVGMPGAPGFGPAFGSGVYLDYRGTETLRSVYIMRSIPSGFASDPQFPQLVRQLKTTRDEFVLKTVIYGSNKVWLKAGVLDQLNCAESGVANLNLIGEGVAIKVKSDGTGEIDENAFKESRLNICINREMIANELPAGDHGALISAYRTENGKVSALPSFTVPVYVMVPHKTLAGSTAYQVQKTIDSFDVSRNYVTIPAGTSVVRLSLEVPPLKVGPKGLPVPGENCSGVELMALEGTNVSKPFKTRKEARIANCDPSGAPVQDESARKLTLTVTDPTPGTWDIHVFGSYKYAVSKFNLRVDYVTATSSVGKIEGGLGALTGSMTVTVKESSMSAVPDGVKSSLEISGLLAETQAKVAKGVFVIVPNPTGAMRSYPAGTKKVTITTGQSPGNDIDLTVFECDSTATAPSDALCKVAGLSNGPTDEESVTFVPKAGKVYAARVDGFDVKDEGKFVSTETITLEAEKGNMAISGASPAFTVNYTMTPEQLKASKLVGSEFFVSKKYSITGALTVRTAEDVVLQAVPVKIENK